MEQPVILAASKLPLQFPSSLLPLVCQIIGISARIGTYRYLKSMITSVLGALLQLLKLQRLSFLHSTVNFKEKQWMVDFETAPWHTLQLHSTHTRTGGLPVI